MTASPPPAPRDTADDGAAAEPFRRQVQEQLDEFVAGKAEQLAEVGPQLDPLLAAAREAVTGGKRLRPAFCHWGWRAAGGAPGETSLVRAAAALELLHASALVHDDVMDDSDTRRGAPAAHRRFARLHDEREWPGRRRQFSVGAAILLGDLLLSWSDQLLRRSGLPADAVARGLPYLDLMRDEVVAGQYLDLVTQNSGSRSVPQVMRVLRYKTAKYTVERPLHLGAALAGGSPDLFAALSSYGLPLGEAYQLRDDVLGVFGDPEETGKPAGDDLREGKRTMLVALALDRATPQQAQLIESLFARPDLDAEGLTRLRGALQDTGARARVEELLGSLVDAAETALDRAGLDPEVTAALRELAASATDRRA